MSTTAKSLAVCLIGMSFTYPTMLQGAELNPSARPVRVVLIGASIGKAWNLPQLPLRTQTTGYEYEALQEWQFDKSGMLEEVLMRPDRKFRFTRTYVKGFFQSPPQPPDIVIIKECSAYFPSDETVRGRHAMVEDWVQEIRAKNIKVVLATAVPVTKQRAAQSPGKQEAVLEFNDWMREYARRNGIALLDLEAATRSDARERLLREDFAAEDGTHLNRTAYDLLDKRMREAVCAVHPLAGCP